MVYNTDREHIIIREYGRHVQSLIQYCVGIEDRVERQATAETIINMMGILNPQLKTVVDYKHLLWDHLHIIANFKLDVDCPYPLPSEDVVRFKPTPMSYPKNKIRLKHYGKSVESLIEKAIVMEDAAKQKAFVQLIANFMKMAYKNWSNEEVSNELIKEDIRTLSKGRLVVSDDMEIQLVKGTLVRNNGGFQRNGRNNNRNGGYQRNGKSSSGRPNNNNNRFKK